MELADTEPDCELSSTCYPFANPGREYLILQPSESGASFTVTPVPGTYRVEWFDVNGRETCSADDVTIDSPVAVTPPFVPAGPAVLYLSRIG